MSQPNTPFRAPVDLSNCDREPIHIPGSIQPHGVLLVLRPEDLQIMQISANCERWLGKAPTVLLHQPGSAIFDAPQLQAIEQISDRPELENSSVYLFSLMPGGELPLLDVCAHRSGAALLLELEPQQRLNALAANPYPMFKQAINRLQHADSLRDFCQQAAEEVRALSGMDRVMIYRFQNDGSGWVYAESRRDDLESYLDLHYPASDIPRQARMLYLRNWLRLIPDIGYQAQPLLPVLNADSEEPLDLSLCSLRSVSPVHVEYLQNMGVAASMSVSLIDHGRLWGLIACHHYSPRYLHYGQRAACELVGQVASLQLAAMEANEHAAYRLRLNSVRERLTGDLDGNTDITEQLLQRTVTLRDFIEAEGVAVCIDQRVSVLGRTPGESDIHELINWLAEEREEDVYVTDSLAAQHARAKAYPGVASGLLAACISRKRREYLLWFRPETIQTVTWAGDPHKPVVSGPLGERLTPRQSFAAWSETVRLRSLPWLEVEVEAARKLRLSIVSAVIERIEELARLNTELSRSNEELDAFAYIVSHDLKEPLRGIYSYTQWLQNDLQEGHNELAREKLQALQRLSKRMEALLDSLLHYSRVGRQKLALELIDFGTLLDEAFEALRSRIRESGVEIRRAQALPTLRCDPIQMGEVFINLLSNAIKYRRADQPWIEIGSLAPGDPQRRNHPAIPVRAAQATVLYVRDNGIGIRARHLERIFTLFKRLHGRDEYGGGTGIGLTVAKKIIERHGGELWVDSVFGEGTTFYFSLGGKQS